MKNSLNESKKNNKLIDFLREAEKMKSVYRHNCLPDQSRKESNAEHTWSMCLMAMLFHKEIGAKTDLRRVLELIVTHDLVEIYGGDTFAYDDAGHEDQSQREKEGAEKLFSLLPPEYKDMFLSRWQEFEAGETDESKFSQALDKVQAFSQNVFSSGACWQEHNVTENMSRGRNSEAMDFDKALNEFCEALYSEAKDKKMWPK